MKNGLFGNLLCPSFRCGVSRRSGVGPRPTACSVFCGRCRGPMAWVALLMGVLMVLNTLLMVVLERTREIGIFAAIGWSTERITGAIVIEGFILSAVGSAAGVVIGVVGSHLLNAIPAIGRFVAVRPTPGLVVATALAAIALGILGSFYPAWLATRQSPAIALGRA